MQRTLRPSAGPPARIAGALAGAAVICAVLSGAAGTPARAGSGIEVCVETGTAVSVGGISVDLGSAVDVQVGGDGHPPHPTHPTHPTHPPHPSHPPHPPHPCPRPPEPSPTPTPRPTPTPVPTPTPTPTPAPPAAPRPAQTPPPAPQPTPTRPAPAR
ncbi:hypothetical protein, partial [Kitasatospora cinereorecta]